MDLDIAPIGFVDGARKAPRDDHWGSERSRITLASEFGPEALYGLDAFSHAEVIFYFDQVPNDTIERGARHPRGNADWPLVGIFAQRGKNRPNRIGVCTCRIVGVDGTSVEVEGLDAIDGTPVLDIKPVMRQFLPRSEVRQPDWVDELMKDYW
jgi:tRNA-Thr(GGU) m(6)t(6)A37 methyltransferase TsaA